MGAWPELVKTQWQVTAKRYGLDKTKVLLLLGGVAAVGVLQSLAAGDGPAAPAISGGDLALRLGLVLVIAFVSLTALRAYMGRPFGGAKRAAGIRVVERCRLGPQQNLYVVTIEDRTLLLGATASTISALTELSLPGQTIARADEPSPLSFGQQLRAFDGDGEIPRFFPGAAKAGNADTSAQPHAAEAGR